VAATTASYLSSVHRHGSTVEGYKDQTALSVSLKASSTKSDPHDRHAVHRAHAKGPQVKWPALEAYEKTASRRTVIPMAQEKYAL